MTQNTRLFKKTLLAVTVAFASGQSMAAGFQINAQSATGIGRAFAGDAVIADNASVMARNPAAMALFDKMELSLGFESITSMIEVKDATYRINNNEIPVANTDDVGDTSIAPNIHLIVPVNDKFAWGVNAYSNFGTKTEFSDSYVATEYGGLTDVKSANFGLAGSYRLNEQWSFGAGLDLIYGQGTMKRTASANLPLVGGAKLLDVDKADGWAVGFNVGTVYELERKLTVLVYLTDTVLSLKRKMTKVRRSHCLYQIWLSSLATIKLPILSSQFTTLSNTSAGVTSIKSTSTT